MYRILALTVSGTSVTGNFNKGFESQPIVLRSKQLLSYKRDMKHQI
jgi:hypothetical protein